jgi:hypothetical protein
VERFFDPSGEPGSPVARAHDIDRHRRMGCTDVLFIVAAAPGPRRGAEYAYGRSYQAGYRTTLTAWRRALLCATGKPRIYNFKGISRGNRRFCSTIEMQKFLVFYILVSLGIRVFEPGGQGFESLRAHFLSNVRSGRTLVELIVEPERG